MKFRLSSEFGVMEEVRNGRAHTGIDLAMPNGTELRSISDGVVERVVDYGSQNIGKGVIIKSEDGTHSIYGHMSEINVKPGEYVNAGEFIGLSGNTGHSSGAHLHFGLKNGGEWVDPTPLAEQLASISGSEPILKMSFLGNSAFDLIKQGAANKAEAVILGTLDGIFSVISSLMYSVTLIGGGILIVLSVAGWKQAKVYASILLIAYALTRYLFGGSI